MEYGPVATKAAQEQFHKENVLDFSMVLKGGKIMEYGPVAAKAAQEQFHKENVLDFSMVCKFVPYPLFPRGLQLVCVCLHAFVQQ